MLDWNYMMEKDSSLLNEKELKKARNKFIYDTPLLSNKDMLDADASMTNCAQSGGKGYDHFKSICLLPYALI